MNVWETYFNCNKRLIFRIKKEQWQQQKSLITKPNKKWLNEDQWRGLRRHLSYGNKCPASIINSQLISQIHNVLLSKSNGYYFKDWR